MVRPVQNSPVNSQLMETDANVGFFVRNDDEYEWLCSLLTIPKINQLLGPEYNGKELDRLLETFRPQVVVPTS